MSEILNLQQLGTLELAAASGVVVLEGLLHVIADDRLTLHRYTLTGVFVDRIALSTAAVGTQVEQVSDSTVPKKMKPDFEALAVLPGSRLLVLGSGSKANRQAGFLWDACTQVGRMISLAPLYQSLRVAFPELNIEGAVVRNDLLVLAQRGNGAESVNGLVELNLAQVLAELEQGELSAATVRRTIRCALGDLGGVPLGLTDLAVAADGRLCFTAAAEASLSTYDDGACLGSVFGWFDRQGQVAGLRRLQPDFKIEGLTWWDEGQGEGHWLMVADADNPDCAAPLLALPGVWPHSLQLTDCSEPPSVP